MPSWKFFEEYGELPVLLIRWGLSPEDLNPWRPAFQPLPRQWTSLFFNPEVNFRHLNENLWQQLKNESESFVGEDTRLLEESTSFLITKALARQQISRLVTNPENHFFQFTLVGAIPGSMILEARDALIVSPIYEWTS